MLKTFASLRSQILVKESATSLVKVEQNSTPPDEKVGQAEKIFWLGAPICPKSPEHDR